MSEILAMAWKDLRLLLRDRGGVFFTFFFPLLMAVFFGSIFSGGGGGGQGLRVAAADEDSSDESRAFLEKLRKAPELRLETLSREEARDRVRRGSQVAAIVLVRGFGEARRNPFAAGAPRIELSVDPARRAEEGMLQGILTKYAAEELEKNFTDPKLVRAGIEDSRARLRSSGAPPEEIARVERFLGELDRFMTAPRTAGAQSAQGAQGGMRGFQPLQIETRPIEVERRGPRNAYAISFPQAILWGVIGCVATFGISIVGERTRGTLVRLQMAPVSRAHILAGKALACFGTAVALTAVLLAIARLGFEVRPQSPGLLALGVLSVSLGFVGIMMALSTLGRTEQAAGGATWAVLLVMSMLGGGSVPLFMMPAWMQSASHFSPVKWGVLAMEGAIWRGFSPQEMLLPCGILLAVGAACFAFGARALRWTE